MDMDVNMDTGTDMREGLGGGFVTLPGRLCSRPLAPLRWRKLPVPWAAGIGKENLGPRDAIYVSV